MHFDPCDHLVFFLFVREACGQRPPWMSKQMSGLSLASSLLSSLTAVLRLW